MISSRKKRLSVVAIAVTAICTLAGAARAAWTSYTGTADTRQFLDLKVVNATAPYEKWTDPGPLPQSCLQFHGKDIGHGKGAGDQITFSCPLDKAGTYNVDLSGYQMNDGGLYEVQFDGKVLGTMDFALRPGVRVNSMDLAAGDHTVTLRLTGTDSNSHGTIARPIWISFLLMPDHQ